MMGQLSNVFLCMTSFEERDNAYEINGKVEWGSDFRDSALIYKQTNPQKYY